MGKGMLKQCQSPRRAADLVGGSFLEPLQQLTITGEVECAVCQKGVRARDWEEHCRGRAHGRAWKQIEEGADMERLKAEERAATEAVAAAAQAAAVGEASKPRCCPVPRRGAKERAPSRVDCRSVPGLSILNDFLGAMQQRYFVTQLRKMSGGWEKVEHKGGHYGGYRLVNQSGSFFYDYRNQELRHASRPAMAPLYEDMQGLIDACELGRGVEAADHVITNQYSEGQGIYPHKDNTEKWKRQVDVVSLGSRARLVMIKGEETQEFWLEPGSLYRMVGDARYKWQHSIKRVDGERFSITLRCGMAAKAQPADLAADALALAGAHARGAKAR